jgi:hypothetical protein
LGLGYLDITLGFVVGHGPDVGFRFVHPKAK